MLTVSRKKILLCRIIMWGGLALAAVGAVFFYISSELYIDLSLALLGGGFVISILGGVAMRRLFRCPNCKKTVLNSDNKIDLRSTNCPDRCPNCGAPVQLTD